MSKPIIEIRNVSKSFGTHNVVDDFSLDIIENEFFSLLGPSGCGKTTLLRMLAGFEVPTSGQILIDGQDMKGIPPNKRPVNMVFQSYAVFPHMNVWDNVAYGLKVSGVAKADIPKKVNEALETVRLQEFKLRKPDQLSGGQRQRVALARALVKRPKVLLLDEPLSALDAKLRGAMQSELKALQAELGITFVVVTHDQSEALGLSERMAIMDEGRLQQVGKPDEIYEMPHNHFTADFIGSVNLYEAVLMADGTTADCPALGGAVTVKNPGGLTEGKKVMLAIRPEKLLLSGKAPESEQWEHVKTKVLGHSYQGNHVLFRLQLPNDYGELNFYYTCRSRETFGYQESIGKVAHIYWHIDDMMMFENQ